MFIIFLILNSIAFMWVGLVEVLNYEWVEIMLKKKYIQKLKNTTALNRSKWFKLKINY